MKFGPFAALSLAGCLLASSSASAGYQFAITGINTGAVLLAGESRTVNVFLNYDGQGAPNVLPQGLFTAWSGLRYSVTGGPATLSIVNAPASGSPPSGGRSPSSAARCIWTHRKSRSAPCRSWEPRAGSGWISRSRR